jgi:hypothetical protein
MKQALQALDLIDKDIEWHDKSPTRKFCNQAAHFLRQAIAEAEKQPVHASDISQECVDETAEHGHDWVGQPDLARVGEVGVWGREKNT